MLTKFNDFLIAADRADSRQSARPICQGRDVLTNPFPFESIPKFQDRVRLGDAFRGAVLDVMLLQLFFVVLFGAAHISFQRKEI